MRWPFGKKRRDDCEISTGAADAKRYTWQHSFSGGKVFIEESALQSLIAYHWRRIKGLKFRGAVFEQKDEGLSVQVKVRCENARLASGFLMEKGELIKRDIETFCMVRVKEVNVLVEEVKKHS